jgi:hypothetical protein
MGSSTADAETSESDLLASETAGAARTLLPAGFYARALIHIIVGGRRDSTRLSDLAVQPGIRSLALPRRQARQGVGEDPPRQLRRPSRGFAVLEKIQAQGGR